MDAIQRSNVVIRGLGTRAMVFAHGFGCDQSMWRFVAPAFEATHRPSTNGATASSAAGPRT